MQVEQEEQLEESSRRLIEREEDLFSYDSVNEEEENELHKDFETLQLKLWMAINDTFTPSSSAGELKVLRSAMVSIQQQVQDRRWRDCQEERVPRWRPQKKNSSIYSILHFIITNTKIQQPKTRSKKTKQKQKRTIKKQTKKTKQKVR